jgi:hypothetical protein
VSVKLNLVVVRYMGRGAMCVFMYVISSKHKHTPRAYVISIKYFVSSNGKREFVRRYIYIYS